MYKIGETRSHEDATATTYESETCTTVTYDSTNDTYSISNEVISTIPQSALKELVGGLVKSIDNKSVTESFEKTFDSQVKEDGIRNIYFSSDFLAEGWPYRIIYQTTMTLGGRGKVNQIHIKLDDINY